MQTHQLYSPKDMKHSFKPNYTSITKYINIRCFSEAFTASLLCQH